jgi:hypothetical protein
MDTFRDGMKLARTFRLVIYVPLLVLLVVIAFMGGRGWAGRVAYAAGCLLISGGIIFAIFGPGYTAFAKTGPIYDTAGVSDLQELRRDALNDITEGGGDFPNTARLAANKAFDTVESIADGFASGIAGDSLTLAMFALAIMVAAIFWGVISGMIDRSLPDESALRRYWKKSL